MKIFLTLFLTTISIFACGIDYNKMSIGDLAISLGMFYIPLFLLILAVGMDNFSRKYFYLSSFETLFIILIYFFIGMFIGNLPQYWFIIVPIISFIPTLIFQKEDKKLLYFGKVSVFVGVYFLYAIISIFGMLEPNHKLPNESKIFYQKIIYGNSIKYPDGSPFNKDLPLDKNKNLTKVKENNITKTKKMNTTK